MKAFLLLMLFLTLGGHCQEVETYPLRHQSYQLDGHWWSPGMVSPQRGSVRVANGRIDALTLPPKEASLETNGLILPGLIDLHDHIGYAYAPRFSGKLWPEEKRFGNRYEWQELTGQFHEKHSRLAKPADALFYLYGEVRELVGGTTSTANHVTQPAYRLLERNLDGDSVNHGLPLNIQSEVFFFEREGLLEDPPRFQVRESAWECVRQADIALVHLAEGRRDDRLTSQEFENFLIWAEKHPSLAKKIVPIHLVGLEAEDFARLKKVGISRAVWSPASNVALYGQTMRVSAALDQGFTLCLGTDWYPSGSDSLFDELRLARKLVADKTISEVSPALLNALLESPQKILGGHLGLLYPGAKADLVVIPWRGDLEASLQHADIDTMTLVTVEGQPLFGTVGLMTKLLKKTTLSPVRPTEYAYGFDVDSIYHAVRRRFPDCVPPETLGERVYSN